MQAISVDKGWKIQEKGWHPERQRFLESLLSLGNGSGGHRAFFEETYSGDTLPGCYLGGIFVPEPIPYRLHRVGLPSTYTRMPNAANWVGIHVAVEGETLDLGRAKVEKFNRSLDMSEGMLRRSFIAELPSGKKLAVEALRFQSLADEELGLLRYAITPLNFSGSITLVPFIDLNIQNELSWSDTRYWVEVESQVKRTHAHIVAETRHSGFQVCSSMKLRIFRDGKEVDFTAFRVQREKYVACSIDLAVEKGHVIELQKFCANLSTRNHPSLGLLDRGKTKVKMAAKAGFPLQEAKHRTHWKKKWKTADIILTGDSPAQQAIRFNIFHLLQAYHGRDENLNFSPKGYTGELSGGCTYWSAEVFCLPFVLGVLGQAAARNMLVYRYRHLPAAIENAGRLGFQDGAALFPMVTITGEECQPDWELAFSAIHRNGAIARSIHEYVNFTGDEGFLASHGLEMLIAIARFWVQRVHWVEHKHAFVLLGVTGPNEYENNVDNNWFTNIMARWCLRYAARTVERVREAFPGRFREIVAATRLKDVEECENWRSVATGIFLPYHEESGIFLQQEGYLDKMPHTVEDLNPSERPLHQHWSWDRILRSPFIQRADVLQGLYFFYEHFSEDVIRRNFEYYEARTVHESSLSPGMHALLAARLGQTEKAYAFFMRSARLDLDDLMGETGHGCHVTSMGGTWMALVMGFAGMRIIKDRLSFQPSIPERWKSYAFRLKFRKWTLHITVTRTEVTVRHDQAQPLPILLYDEWVEVLPGQVGAKTMPIA